MPEAPALVLGGRCLTYAALHSEANLMARRLSAAGARPGVLAAVLDDACDLALLAHAAPILGAALFPLNPALPGEILASLLRAAGVKQAVSSECALPPGVIRLRPRFHAGPEGGEVSIEDGGVVPLSPESVHAIVATSGSGGEPRAAMLTGSNLAASAAAACSRIALGPGDRWLACLPLYHIGGLSILYRCAHAGATAVVHTRFDSGALARALAREAISHVSLVPPMLARLLDAGVVPPPSLRAALVGGANLAPALARRAHDAGWPLCVTYGMTETASQLATECGPEAGETPGRVGRPLPGFELGLTPEGRIRARGPAVMAGYANPSLAHGDGREDGWFLTSDLGRLDEQGCLHVLGRADDVLVTGGVNVHPAQVEALLSGCPGVSAVGLTARQDPVWGDYLVAFYEGDASPQGLADWCRERLPGAWRPREWHRVEQLPRTTLAKLNRVALRAMAEAA
jgi:o-succinylbenzoate---CoA ligase